MSGVRLALVISFAERYALIAMSLLSNMLIARLLKPEDIGIYSVSLSVIGIAQVLRDFGIGNFLIQEKHLTEAHIRTAFGFSLVLGLVLFAGTFFSAPFVGDFYHEPRIVETMQISAINFLALPFCTVSRSLLYRDMLFKRLAVVNLLAALVGSLTTIGLAYAGFGTNSMAIGAVAVTVVTGIVAWLVTKGHRLYLPSFSEWRLVARFGGQNSIAGIVTSVSMDANDLIVGKVLGFYPVAILSRAQGLMNLFHRDLMGAVRNVALPAFAAEYRAGANLEQHYVRSVAIITAIAWPFYGAMSIYALEALRLLFGNQWDAASALVPLFCLSGAVAALTSLIPLLLVAVGRNDLATGVDLLLQPMRVVLILLAALIFQTTEGCALGFLLSTTIAMPVFYFFKSKAIKNNFKSLLKKLLSSGLITVSTLLLPLMQAYSAGFSRHQPIPLLELMAVIPLAIVLWIVSLKLFKHPLAEEPWFDKYIMRNRKVMNPPVEMTK